MNNKNPITNKVLIPCVIAAALLLMSSAYIISISRSPAEVVRIYQDGELVREINLSEISEPYTIDMGTNQIEADASGVRMLSADCPDKLCVKQGSISKAGESIICLPNKIIIEFEGNDYGNVDAVTR
ncbi:MAG: NusG domain II-containing protein [Clostridia bacterium]|nr:NusG domain II-containing protein [Clostridia bacterium]